MRYTREQYKLANKLLRDAGFWSNGSKAKGRGKRTRKVRKAKSAPKAIYVNPPQAQHARVGVRSISDNLRKVIRNG